MILTFDDVLASDGVARIVESLRPEDFVDGKKTAGWHAKLVKHNTQLAANDERTRALVALVHDSIAKHEEFSRAFKTKSLRAPMISRYVPGMSYGAHVDDPFMGTSPMIRTDISITLFLSDPSSYEGGELIIESTFGLRAIKLPPGAMVVYPSTTLHRVAPVTSGVRLAAVSWAQCVVSDPFKREILYDLDNARRAIFKAQGKTAEFDLVSKSHANLMRMWSDL